MKKMQLRISDDQIVFELTHKYLGRGGTAEQGRLNAIREEQQ